MKILELFIAATIPVLKVLLITALGSFLAFPSIDILGEEARKHLNAVTFYVFNPALVSSSLAKTITYESMVKMWFMPLNIFITFVVGSIFGWIVLQLTKPPPHLRGLILGCCSAGNLGNMLLIIIPTVCKEKGSPFGSSDSCNVYGIAYASLSMAIGAIFLWLYVYNLVRISSRTKTSTTASRVNVLSINDDKLPSASSSVDPLICEPLLNSSNESLILKKDSDSSCILPCTSTDVKAEVPVAGRLRSITKFFKSLNLKALLAPSTSGAIVGFVVGLIPQIRKLMIGNNAPLRVINDSATLLGNGAIPTITLIIGGNLLKGLKGSEMKKTIIIGIVIARYIALPLTGVLIVRGAMKFGFIGSDPLYMFVLLLQYAVPPAMNIGTITQLFGAGENECSVIMLWTYALASVSLTLWSTFFLWLVS